MSVKRPKNGWLRTQKWMRARGAGSVSDMVSGGILIATNTEVPLASYLLHITLLTTTPVISLIDVYIA